MKKIIAYFTLIVLLSACTTGPIQTIKIKATPGKSDNPMEILAGEKIQKQPAKVKLVFKYPGDKYRFKQNDIVEIVRILHQRMDVKKRMK